MFCKELNKESEMNAKRSAFVMFIEVAEEYFPNKVKYVETNKNKTLREIFSELHVELRSISNN